VVKATRPSHALEEYEGEYAHPGYRTLRVKVRGKRLQVRLAELDLSAKHRHFDTWTVGYQALGAEWPMTFVTNADGQISAAEMPLESTIKPIRFERAIPPEASAKGARP
jgi:hypothetical protein